MGDIEELLGRVSESAGGAFKFGQGVVGKTTIAICVFLAAVVVAVWRLQAELLVLAALGIGAVVFLGWFASILYHARNHPANTLLEGAEWSSYKRFEASAKGIATVPRTPAIADPLSVPALPEAPPPEPDK